MRSGRSQEKTLKQKIERVDLGTLPGGEEEGGDRGR